MKLTELIKKLNEKGVKTKLWEKGREKRIYCDGFHYSKSFYVDLVRKEIVGNRAGTFSDIRNICSDILEIEVGSKDFIFKNQIEMESNDEETKNDCATLEPATKCYVGQTRTIY